MELTDSDFWDEYWNNVKVPCRVNMSFSFERCLDAAFSKIFRPDAKKKLIEIGCAPGKWMVYFHEKYGYEVSGLDSSPHGINKTWENLQYHKIGGKVYNEDFFRFQAPEKYDIVISLGFIEHFKDTDKVIEKHISLLAENAFLILGVPNFQGINKTIQKHASEEILKKHNLSIMNREFFESLPERFPLETVSIRYLCGFEPELFIAPKPRMLFRIMRKTSSILRRIKVLDSLNSRYFSGYILAAYRMRNK